MKTFKVTFFFQSLEIASVVTYHNVINQSALLDNIANNITGRELAKVVRCTADNGDYTSTVNQLLDEIFTNTNK